MCRSRCRGSRLIYVILVGWDKQHAWRNCDRFNLFTGRLWKKDLTAMHVLWHDLEIFSGFFIGALSLAHIPSSTILTVTYLNVTNGTDILNLLRVFLANRGQIFGWWKYDHNYTVICAELRLNASSIACWLLGEGSCRSTIHLLIKPLPAFTDMALDVFSFKGSRRLRVYNAGVRI